MDIVYSVINVFSSEKNVKVTEKEGRIGDKFTFVLGNKFVGGLVDIDLFKSGKGLQIMSTNRFDYSVCSEVCRIDFYYSEEFDDWDIYVIFSKIDEENHLRFSYNGRLGILTGKYNESNFALNGKMNEILPNFRKGVLFKVMEYEKLDDKSKETLLESLNYDMDSKFFVVSEELLINSRKGYSDKSLEEVLWIIGSIIKNKEELLSIEEIPLRIASFIGILDIEKYDTEYIGNKRRNNTRFFDNITKFEEKRAKGQKDCQKLSDMVIKALWE